MEWKDLLTFEDACELERRLTQVLIEYEESTAWSRITLARTEFHRDFEESD